MTDEQRKKIFENICAMTWTQTEVFVTTAVVQKECQHKTVESSRRSASVFYYLNVDGNSYKECRTMFLATMGLRNWWDNSRIDAQKPNEEKKTRPLHPAQKQSKERESLKAFLVNLAKVPSCYCRQST